MGDVEVGDGAVGGEAVPVGSLLVAAPTGREGDELCPVGTGCVVAQETTSPAMRMRTTLLPAHSAYFNFNNPREPYLTNSLFKLPQLYFFRDSLV
ncbi:MAG TPA: hypothetical protein VMW69_02090 [Spirochaetia bacterium]|nr:hypothetical protein [Spirochaetia bacterium]